MTRVLLTRDRERSADLAQALEKIGLSVAIEPVTRTVYEVQGLPWPGLAGWRWLAFTSVPAVVAFSQALRETGATLPPRLKIAAVGPATAAEISRRLRTPDYAALQAHGASLAQELLAADPRLPGSALLWPCAAQPRDEFPQALTRAGVRVVPWPCYRTEAVPSRELADRLKVHAPWQAAVFAAPSAVEAFVQAWPPPWDFAAAALGATTAEALREAGAGRVIVSPGTGTEDLVRAVVQALNVSSPERTPRP